MQDRVLDAANILVYRHPVAGGRRVGGPLRTGGTESCEVPGRIHEGIEGIGLALGSSAAARTVYMFPGRVAIKGVAGLIKSDIVGEGDRKRVLRHGNNAAAIAVNNRNWAAPIALAGNTPVAKPIVDPSLANPRLLHPCGDFPLGIDNVEAIEEIGVDEHGLS